MTEQRLTDIEIKISELEQTVADLNDIVTRQWQLIDKHSVENKHLIKKIKLLEEVLKSGDKTPPPHY
ncbi:MAG: SlyX family protein [Alphaproteobacteria bacterium]|nr:SlyX family protein [Alphaproteobacteria bacterium]